MSFVASTSSARRPLRALIVTLAALAVWSMLPAAAQAAFPGANGKLAYGSARNGFPADNDLYTMGIDGAAQTRITSLNLDELNPAWSPNGAKIAYERVNGFRSDIWVANGDGTGAIQLTTHARNDTRPSWSPTGKKIVFASDRAGRVGVYDLFVMDPNGANQVAITNTPTISEEYPAWSPDGSAIAFSRDGDIYKSTPTGTNLKQITSATTNEIEPDWHPNNGWIVYRAGMIGDDELWKTTANGGPQIPLTTNSSVPEERPVWSPQGDKIAFIRGMFKDAEVYTMNADGTGVTRVTNNTQLDSSPTWQPIPFASRFVRPKGATYVRTALVPSYRPCKAPNRTHGPPWAYGSCNPPKLYSRYLTIGSPDVNGQVANFNGYVRISVTTGNPATPEDEADVKVQIKIPDVRNKTDLTDYTGQLRVRAEYRRQTDKESAVGTASPIESATSTDTAWGFAVQCAATADTTIGSLCQLTTTRDAVVPGSFKEGKRAMLQFGRIQVWDGGADGVNSTKVNDLFLTQGIFVP